MLVVEDEAALRRVARRALEKIRGPNGEIQLDSLVGDALERRTLLGLGVLLDFVAYEDQARDHGGSRKQVRDRDSCFFQEGPP